MSQHTSICRVCVNSSAIVADIVDGRLVRVTGDRSDPLYQGYTCVKGRAQPQILEDPGRLLRSLKRDDQGRYAPIPVDQALDEIAERLGTQLDEHGPRSVAGYLGTHGVDNPLTVGLFYAFMFGIGSRMCFTPSTIDKGGKQIAQALHGEWQAPAQGYDRPDAIILLGANPLVSYSGFPNGNPGKWLSAAQRRGLKLVVIDPRHTDVAKRAFLHIQPRPGQDVAILAALIHTILEERLYDDAFVAENAVGLEELRGHVAPFDPISVARHADVDADDIVVAARTFAAAERGYIFAGTGPNMTGYGTLVEYLILDLETICGRWLRVGETVANPGVLAGPYLPKAQASPPRPGFGFGERLRVHDLTMTTAGLPLSALPDEILLPGEGQVRAFISCGGNPAAVFPDQHKVIEALEALDLLVQIDPWMTQTAAYAHYVIAPRIGLEEPGSTYWMDGLSRYAIGYGFAEPYANHTPALVTTPEGSELVEQWEVFYGLGRRLGIPMRISPKLTSSGQAITLDFDDPPSSDELLELISRASRIPLRVVKEQKGGFFPEPEVAVAPKDPGWTGRFDLVNGHMMSDLRDFLVEGAQDSHADLEFPFRLLSRRMAHVYNSSVNIPATNRGRGYNPAFIHPDDLADLGVVAGSTIEIRSRRSTIKGVAQPDPTLKRGTVSMTHGFGGPPGTDAEVRRIGSSTNRLVDLDGRFDSYSGQPLMSNIPVRVVALPHDDPGVSRSAE